MFPGSGSCLVCAPWASNGWAEGTKQEEIVSASQLGFPSSPSWSRLTPLHSQTLLGSAIKQNQRKLMETVPTAVPLKPPPLPALAIKKLVSFTVKTIDFFPPSGQPCIMFLPGSEGCVFHQYVSFGTFIYRIKEELSWVSCYLASPDLKYSWKKQAAL